MPACHVVDHLLPRPNVALDSTVAFSCNECTKDWFIRLWSFSPDAYMFTHIPNTLERSKDFFPLPHVKYHSVHTKPVLFVFSNGITKHLFLFFVKLNFIWRTIRWKMIFIVCNVFGGMSKTLILICWVLTFDFSSELSRASSTRLRSCSQTSCG